jgi:predicted transglutaminase-like cysteine proteinase
MGSNLGIMMLIASLAGFGLQPAWSATPYPFDDTGFLGDAALMPDWSATMQRQYDQTTLLQACIQDKTVCKSYYKGVRHLLIKAADLPPERQIRLVNHYVNRKRYKNDRASRMDTPLSDQPLKYRSHWATVEEFIRRGGDCEDYATTKYFLLRQLGFDVDKLRIVVTYDRGARGYHAVLAVKHPDGKVLLLESDNLIRTGSRHRYRFIYSVNEKSIWDHESVSHTTRHQRERPA